MTFLYAVATALAMVLLVAVLVAVRAYRRKARKLAPGEITPDAE